ncbi:Arylsulfatase [Pontiella desulfatans]|uniref:Arylsulfatase n=1 Tax=Pontiella desulfatans TaxID=2750659 RepID=A0A6C2U6C3_PONDE|nr:sulfatase [Pontiella desulfatans]SPS73978.1 sulfatase S1_25 [Kiritimatiellales bacterium]VGO15453.1 Arylsulfatase [Pontiella desulfatans]
MKRTTLLAAALLSAAVVNAEKRPNIVYLMSDDQSSYTMGCYGNADVQTPNLDRLAADGMVFDNHYDTTAICMASRATVMAGMYEYKTGCNFKHGEMLTATWKKTYPMLLREAGYMTAFAGKFGFELRDTPEGKKRELPAADFDRWGGGPGQTFYETAKNKSMAAYAEAYPHSTLSYGAFGRDFIRDAAKAGKPFCLSISFKAAHRPTTPDPKFDAVYAGKTFRKPENYGRGNGAHFSKQSKQGRQYVRFEEWDYDKDYDGVMATYHQQVYGIDVAVGMIVDALKEQGVADNTVIIYTSDNGFFCGSHGLGSKVLPYEEASRVPMIIHDPRHPNSGKKLRSDALTGNIDFAPTLLKLAGLPVPATMDGADLMKLYGNPKASIHESLALINVYNQSGPPVTHAMAVVTREMKYIYWGYAAEGFEVAEELYHLGKDPHELVNQAGNPEYSAALQQMRQTYDKHLGHWKAEAVPYNNYQPYGTLFDRNVGWDDKAPLLPKLKNK